MANNRETITDHFTEDLREGGLEEEKEKVDSDSEGLPPIIPVDEEEEDEGDVEEEGGEKDDPDEEDGEEGEGQGGGARRTRIIKG